MLNTRQLEIVDGSLLGDGCIWTNFIDPLMKWQILQSQKDHLGVDKKSYICWYVNEFFEVGCSVRAAKYKTGGVVVSDKEYERYVFYTKCGKGWNEIEKRWYVPRTDHPTYRRRKVIPKDLRLTPLSLCIWYMDDGTSNAKDANITLETQGFDPEEVGFLIERLNVDLNVRATPKKATKKGQFRIYIGRKSYFDLIEIVKPHVQWDCFQYKLDTTTYKKKPNRGETSPLAKLTESKAKDIFALRDQGMYHKEIAQEMGVSEATISNVLSGKRWSHLGMQRDRVLKPRLSQEFKDTVIQLKNNGLSQNDIASQLQVGQGTISRLLKAYKQTKI